MIFLTLFHPKDLKSVNHESLFNKRIRICDSNPAFFHERIWIFFSTVFLFGEGGGFTLNPGNRIVAKSRFCQMVLCARYETSSSCFASVFHCGIRLLLNLYQNIVLGIYCIQPMITYIESRQNEYLLFTRSCRGGDKILDGIPCKWAADHWKVLNFRDLGLHTNRVKNMIHDFIVALIGCPWAFVVIQCVLLLTYELLFASKTNIFRKNMYL